MSYKEKPQQATTKKVGGPTLSLHSLITTASRLELGWVAVKVLMTEPRRLLNLPLSSLTWSSRVLFSSSKQRAWRVQCVFTDQATEVINSFDVCHMKLWHLLWPVQWVGPGGHWGQQWWFAPEKTGPDPLYSEPWQKKSQACHSHTRPWLQPWKQDRCSLIFRTIKLSFLQQLKLILP